MAKDWIFMLFPLREGPNQMTNKQRVTIPNERGSKTCKYPQVVQVGLKQPRKHFSTCYPLFYYFSSHISRESSINQMIKSFFALVHAKILQYYVNSVCGCVYLNWLNYMPQKHSVSNESNSHFNYFPSLVLCRKSQSIWETKSDDQLTESYYP